MSLTQEIKKNEVVSRLSVDTIHEQMSKDPRYPFDLQSGWMPPPNHAALQSFYKILEDTPSTDWADCIKELDAYITADETVTFLVNNACKENQNLRDSNDANGSGVIIPAINNKDELLDAFNKLLNHAPAFYDNALVGLPFSALVVGIDPTPSGVTLFSLPGFNKCMSKILNYWNNFLSTFPSSVGFSVEGQQWLSDVAKKQYKFEDWKKDSETLPYWTSWNNFFTRQFKDAATARPIADPTSNRTVICPNDGSLYRWRPDIQRNDVFWFKDMDYSLADILSSPDPAQQAIIDQYDLVNIFEGGYIFQTYLNPYNFHRWWVPVNGTIMFDPLVVPGFFFNKLVVPDFGGATTASLPYLAQVNARGIIVFETDYGRVCCIPLGMSETSTITFDPAMSDPSNRTVSKGQEMGTFNYGGSSFVVIYEKIAGKSLVFMDAEGNLIDQNPPLPSSSSSTGVPTNIGAQIGLWVDM